MTKYLPIPPYFLMCATEQSVVYESAISVANAGETTDGFMVQARIRETNLRIPKETTMKQMTGYMPRMWFMALLLTALTAGCGGGAELSNGGGASTPKTTKAITSYVLAGVVGTINEPARIITVTVPFATNVTALVATFTTTGASVKVGTTVQVSNSMPNNFIAPVAYIVTAEDASTATYIITVTVASSTAKAMTAFSFAGYSGATGSINEPAKTIAVTVPFATDVTALVATFSSTGINVKVGTTVQTSTSTANNFTGSVAYIVTAADSTIATYTVTVTVASNTAKAMTAFSFAGYSGATGSINEPAKTIAVIVPFATDVTALVATFTTTGTVVKIGAAVQTSASTANNFTGSVAYIVTAADSTVATYTVTVTIAANTAKAMTAFSFAGYSGATGSINELAKTIAVTVPFATDVTALVATFTTTGTVVKIGAAVQTSGTTANDFTTAQAYLVTAADASTVTYTVTVMLAANSAKAITAFSLAGAAGLINESGKAIAVTVPNGTNLTTLVATFTATGTGVTVAAAVQTSGSTVNDFSSSVNYTVTAADSTTVTYTVTVSLATANPTAPVLGEAGRFVILASQAVTTTGTSAISDGDIGIIDIPRTGITGFTSSGPAGDYAELANGTSFAPDDVNPSPFPYPLHFSTPTVGATWTTTAAMITQVRTDLGIADTFLAADPNPGAPTQACQAELGGLTLTRGVYKSAVNVVISTGDLHLDAQGDPNAVFIFVIAGTFTTGAPGGNIILENGALARNVFWRSGGNTVIGPGTTFYGNVFAATQVNLLAGANVTGRLFAVTDRVTLIADTVKKAP
jgi:hypothetical protein